MGWEIGKVAVVGGEVGWGVAEPCGLCEEVGGDEVGGDLFGSAEPAGDVEEVFLAFPAQV